MSTITRVKKFWKIHYNGRNYLIKFPSSQFCPLLWENPLLREPLLRESTVPLLKALKFGINAVGAQRCSCLFTFCHAPLKIALLLHKMANECKQPLVAVLGHDLHMTWTWPAMICLWLVWLAHELHHSELRWGHTKTTDFDPNNLKQIFWSSLGNRTD